MILPYAAVAEAPPLPADRAAAAAGHPGEWSCTRYGSSRGYPALLLIPLTCIVPAGDSASATAGAAQRGGNVQRGGVGRLVRLRWGVGVVARGCLSLYCADVPRWKTARATDSFGAGHRHATGGFYRCTSPLAIREAAVCGARRDSGAYSGVLANSPWRTTCGPLSEWLPDTLFEFSRLHLYRVHVSLCAR